MADVKAITLARLRKLVSRSDCAYLYNNGDVAFATTERYKGKEVTFSHLVKGYVSKVTLVRYLEADTYRKSDTEEGLVYRVIVRRDAFGALFLARPDSAAIVVNSQSEASLKAGLGYNSVRFWHDAAAMSTELGYLSMSGSTVPHLIANDITIQVSDTGFGEGLALPMEDEKDHVYTLDRPEAAEASETPVRSIG